MQRNRSRRINPHRKRYCFATFKNGTKWGERKSDENMKRIHVIHVKVKRNVGDRVSTAAVRKYNLHSQVAELLSATDVRNHIRSLLFNHTPILYRARLFIAFFPLWTDSFNILVVRFYSYVGRRIVLLSITTSVRLLGMRSSLLFCITYHIFWFTICSYPSYWNYGYKHMNK